MYALVSIPSENKTISDPEVLIYFWSKEYKTLDLTQEAAKIKVPNLILAGKLDPIIPWTQSKRLSQAIAPSKLELFENSGHGVFRDEPEKFLKTVNRFLDLTGN